MAYPNCFPPLNCILQTARDSSQEHVHLKCPLANWFSSFFFI